MLIHEFYLLSNKGVASGWDEIWDSSSVPGYTFYGLAPLGTDINNPNWWISVTKNTAPIVDPSSSNATRTYPANQIWANRGSLALP